MEKLDIENEIKRLMGQWVRLKKSERINKIRYAGPDLRENEYESMLDAIFNDWWSGGKYTIKSESLLAEISDRNKGLLFNSGSSANLILMAAAKELYFKDNDKILTLSCGFPTTVNPIIQNRLIPVFVDVDENFNLSPETLEYALKKDKKIKGVFVAHTLGFKSEINDILNIARKYDTQVFFDGCDAYGTTYMDRPIQAYGKATSLSFYVAHHVTMGEGGGVVTNDNEMFTIMRGMRNWGKHCDSDRCCIRSENPEAFCPTSKYSRNTNLPDDYMVKYQFEWLGYNLKPLELQSAILYEQLKRIPDFTKIRQTNYAKLFDFFKNIPYFKVWAIDNEISPFSFPLLIKNDVPFNRKHLIDHYTRNKIESRVLFGGNLMKHPAYEKNKNYWESMGSHENADKILTNFLMLGVSHILTDNDINKIIEVTTKFLKQWQTI